MNIEVGQIWQDKNPGANCPNCKCNQIIILKVDHSSAAIDIKCANCSWDFTYPEHTLINVFAPVNIPAVPDNQILSLRATELDRFNILLYED